MCPAHFHFVSVEYWTMSVALVLCLMEVLQILSFGLTLSIFLSMALWRVSSFFTDAFVRDHVSAAYRTKSGLIVNLREQETKEGVKTKLHACDLEEVIPTSVNYSFQRCLSVLLT